MPVRLRLNYARCGYAANRLRFGGLVTFNGQRLRSTLGGAGLSVSDACRHVATAVAFARFVAEPSIQCIYVASGGQPGYRAAWNDDLANALGDRYFRDTLPTLDAAFLRPRYAGYPWFQGHAAPLVHACLAGERSAERACNGNSTARWLARTRFQSVPGWSLVCAAPGGSWCARD
ncbi:hypothetical protein [Roseiflexus sp.]|uniref:hypothetical protein n=1 Tax=Roseiflexus sp. TaxID=2562120 RepID=UPI002582F01F|nr:hypothetical protein [Roseiflexus sp.]